MPRRLTLRLLVCVVGGCVLAGALVRALIPFRERVVSVDLNSGRIRRQRFILGLLVDEEIEENELFYAAREFGLTRGAADWRTAAHDGLPSWGIMAARRHFPHSETCAACSQLSDVLRVRRRGNMPEAESRELVTQFMKLMREEDVQSLSKLAFDALLQSAAARRNPAGGAGDGGP